MGKFNALWFSLHGRIRICLVVFSVGMVLAASYAFGSSWISVRGELRRYFGAVEDEIESNMENYFRSIENIARRVGYSVMVQQYLLSENPETVIFSFSAAAAHITDSLGISENCVNIYVQAGNRRYLRSNLSYIEEARKLLRETAPEGAISRPFFAGIGGAGERSDGLLMYFFPVYSILTNKPQNTITGVLICGMKPVTKPPFSAGFDQGALTFLRYGDSIIFSSGQFEDTRRILPGGIKTGQDRVRIGGRFYQSIKVSGQDHLWDYIYLVPEGAVFARVFAMVNKSIPILSVVVLLMFFFVVLIVYSVNSGITKMVADLNTLEYGGRLPPGKPRLKELELISHSVDFMLDRINGAVRREQEANEKLLEAVTAQAYAEFISYRSQINPHFLFNTLECMRAMAHSSSDADLELIISSMSRMFRYSLYAKPVVSLSLELEHLQNYMKVMNIRSGNRYSFKLNVCEEAMNRLIPSMILQPLAENAVAHGFSGQCRNKAVIMLQALYAEGSGGPLLLRFADNGRGINEETLNALLEMPESNKETAHALCNIRRRMRLSFGQGFSFTIKSREGYYTVIEMRIPSEAELLIPEIK